MKLLLSFLLPLFLFGEQIELVHDTPIRYWILEAEKALTEKQTELVQSRLKGNFKSDETRYYVFWNKPHTASRKKLLQIPKNRAILLMWEPPTVQKKTLLEKIFKAFQADLHLG